MFVRYYVISDRGSIGDYVSLPKGDVDDAREAARKLAAHYPDCRFYIVEAFEYAEVVPKWETTVDFVQLEVP